MDPRAMAEKKAAAMTRIESVLDELISKFGLDSTAVGDIRHTYHDPDLMDLRRVESIAELLEGVFKAVGKTTAADIALPVSMVGQTGQATQVTRAHRASRPSVVKNGSTGPETAKVQAGNDGGAV